jgi:hypothetical protein
LIFSGKQVIQFKIMTAQAITSEIESRASARYTTWHIGVTNDPDGRRQDCERDGARTDFWTDWRADSADDAKEIAQRYINRGMKSMTAGELNPRKDVFVFIF